jgi:cytochrome c-type biogenesis protein CcmH
VSRKLLPWFALVPVVAAGLVVLVARSGPDDSAPARAARLERQLACPECTGESVADSNAVSARVIREQIRTLIAEGRSDADIRAHFAARFGDRVLLTPANRGIGLVAWVVPIVVLLVGGAGLAAALRRWSRTPRLRATPEDEAVVAAAREQAP